MTMTTTDTPRIYVASLSDYNAGRLHGRWIDATQDSDAIAEEVAAMLAESSEPIAEEWAIHDYDGFGSLNLGEWESFEKVAELGQAIAEHGAEVVAAYVNNMGEWSAEGFSDSYVGEFPSLADYAQDVAEEMGTFLVQRDRWATETEDISSQWPFTCIDWDKAGRELEMSGDIWTADASNPEHWNAVHVFRSI